MAMEVSCGQCHRRLLIETAGVIVACPHCGVHLSLPEATADPLLTPLEDVPREPEATLETVVPLETKGPLEIETPLETEVASWSPTPVFFGKVDDDCLQDLERVSTPADFDAIPDVGVGGTSASQAEILHEFRQLPSPSVAETASNSLQKEASSGQTFLSLLLIVIGTYASLLTMYVIYLTLFSRSHQLESLPDLKTVPQVGGRVAVPGPEHELPPGHQLTLGQSRRYGNIRVTPIRITRGPMSFVHFDGDADRTRPPSAPVLKLWLHFENVSSEQTIMPLDTTLMYFHRGLDKVISFNALFPAADRKKKDGRFYYHFDRLPPDSEWLIVGQQTNRALQPHEAFDLFVPSEEEIEDLSGQLIWRVHFRKGHARKSGNGVTTLIEVGFDAAEIEPESV
ncbi:MAG: hypothetical protein DWI02_00630 [Planctomycetota bacterium]|nr:MAG: hypothetical protein DWI02_00630 [Planctomycetota bacterium]